MKKLVLGFIVLAVIGVIVGLSIYLTKSNGSSSDNSGGSDSGQLQNNKPGGFGEIKNPDNQTTSGAAKDLKTPKPSIDEPPRPVPDSIRRDSVVSSLSMTPNPANSAIPWITSDLPLLGKGKLYLHSLNPNYWKYIRHAEPNWNIEHIYIAIPCNSGVCLDAAADFIMNAIQNPAMGSVLIHTKDDRYTINSMQNICSDATGRADIPYSYDRTYYVYNKKRGDNYDLPEFLLYNWNDTSFRKKMAELDISPPKSASGLCKAYPK